MSFNFGKRKRNINSPLNKVYLGTLIKREFFFQIVLLLYFKILLGILTFKTCKNFNIKQDYSPLYNCSWTDSRKIYFRISIMLFCLGFGFLYPVWRVTEPFFAQQCFSVTNFFLFNGRVFSVKIPLVQIRMRKKLCRFFFGVK